MKEYNINDLYVVIVVYNTSCQDSISYNRAKDSSVKIIVCDNSTSDYGNEEIVKNDGNIYINMGGNNGLSKAYNAAIQVINKDNRYICLFDDDTDMGKKYFDKVLSYINMSNADILLPVVKTSTRILSPCQFKKKRCVDCASAHRINYSTETDVITTSSVGTSWWKPLLPVFSFLILSTTSMPSTTSPNTA